MRLRRLESGHRPGTKLFLWIVEKVSRKEPSDVVKTLYYRPEHFGAAYSALMHKVMRGGSDWTIGERELFAAFVSSINRCAF